MRRLGLMLCLLLLAISTPLSLSSQTAAIVVPRDYPTIQEAIYRAPVGGIIQVESGTYPEELLITRSLTLRADTSKGEVQLLGRPDKAVLTIIAANVTVQGFTFVYSTTAVQVFKSMKVNIAQNTFRPTIFGSLDHAIEVVEAREVTIQDNRIRGADDGIAVRENAAVEIVRNTIEGSYWGVALYDNAQAVIHHNVITENLFAGVLLWEQGQATITDNNILENVMAGVAVRGGARHSSSENAISRTQGSGVVLRDQVEATLRDNFIEDNAQCGIEVTSGVRVYGSANTIARNRAGDLCPPDFPWPPLFY